MATTRKTKSKVKRETVYSVGYARLPDGTTAKHVFGVLALGLEIEKESGEIVEFSCALYPSHAENFLRQIMVGRNFEREYDLICEKIRSRYFDRACPALLAALDDVRKRLQEARKNDKP